jgi:hypothetical protein
MKKRLIKNEEIINLKKNSKLLHPITGEPLTNIDKDNICLTKFKYSPNNAITTYNSYKCINNLDNYNKYMYTPPIGISSSDLLKIYSINNNIDDLDNWINNTLNESIRPNYFTINRIMNAWIKNNFDTLKSYNNILEKIYYNLLQLYLDSDIINKIDKDDIYTFKNIKKDIKNYIDYWFNKKNPNEFDFDLLTDIIEHIKLKYNKTKNNKYKKN